MSDIAIIGAGLSGRLLALNLCRYGSSNHRIRQIDRGDPGAMGPAYSAREDYLRLNVPAGRMGAYADDPAHFLSWARQRGIDAGEFDFLPRRLYREYIFELLERARRAHPNGPPLEYVRGEVTDIELSGGGATIRLASGQTFDSAKAVLALGNFPPRHPPIKNRAALQSPRYARDPWAFGVLNALSPSDRVFIIGTGQTTVDLLLALESRAHRGPIVALSRRGIFPLAHGRWERYPSFYAEISASQRTREVFRSVRKHLARAQSLGIDPRAVIDSMRPDTQALWQSLPESEKRRFLRHGFRYWEIIRSRIPIGSEALLQRMRSSGRLRVIAGRIRDMADTASALEVCYTPHGGERDRVERADLVLNCIGPESDYERVDHPLAKNLLRRGLIRPGPARLGLDAQPNGAVVGRGGVVSEVLYTLGSPMKGVLWEVIAVPEIRVQAQQLARLLVER